MNKVATTEKKPVKKRQPKVDLPATPENMLMTALKEGMSIEVIEKLLTLKERIEKNEAEKAYQEAMSKFQAECPVIPKKKPVKNKDGKTTRYKYAPIDDIVPIVYPIMTKNNLSFTVKTHLETKDEISGMTAVAKISHILGHSETTDFWAPIDDNEYMTRQQRYGSTRTFTSRYALCDALGIITGDEDNDTNDPQNLKDQEEAKKAELEAHTKLKAMPENVINGFKALGYITEKSWKAAWKFAEARKWNPEAIAKELNFLADKETKKNEQ
jgi:hypothetical protein